MEKSSWIYSYLTPGENYGKESEVKHCILKRAYNYEEDFKHYKLCLKEKFHVSFYN